MFEPAIWLACPKARDRSPSSCEQYAVLFHGEDHVPSAEDTMAIRKTALCQALSGLTATATAQTGPILESWVPIGRAQAITGRVTFTHGEITFQNGKSLPLANG